MIVLLLINVVLVILGMIFKWFPQVTVADIPFIGEAVSGFLYSVVGVWNAFMVTFPYAQTAWDVFLYVIVPFEILLKIGKAIFGSRMISHDVN